MIRLPVPDPKLQDLVRQVERAFRQRLENNSQAVFETPPANYASDAAAAAGGVPLGGLYRNGSVLMVRVS